jgi:PE family
MAAATDLGRIGAEVDAAHLAAAGPTAGLIPAAADEVSAAVAALLAGHAQDYQAGGVSAMQTAL